MIDQPDNNDPNPTQLTNPQPDTTSNPAPAGGGDIFNDLSKIRIGQEFADRAATRKLLLKVPVRKPSKEWFVRTHPDPAYTLDCYILELKDSADSFSGESYFVVPEVALALDGESTIRQTKLITAINRQGVVFLWPIKLPLPGRNLDNWNQSALEIASDLASESWVRVTANQTLGAYDCFEAMAKIADPEWPQQSLQDLLRIAFEGRVIDTVQHDVVKKLRGQM